MVTLMGHQREAIAKLDSGSILCGGVGTGKSITSLAYFYTKECSGRIGEDFSPMLTPCPLCIITTARKRDTKEWEKELDRFPLEDVTVTIDSWNNIHKYEALSEDTFFIFDEQRVIGSGAWAKSFVKIAKNHRWLLLTATPGDTWLDYIPVFIANGFYKNRTEFIREHVIFSRFTKFPKVQKYVNTRKLEMLRRSITVVMSCEKKTARHSLKLHTGYNEVLYQDAMQKRWNPFSNEPVRDAGGLCYLLRRIVNADESRLQMLRALTDQHSRMIVFYNFDYELEALKTLSGEIPIAQWNGHVHEPIPKTERWLYLVQYTAGAEGWNCIETNAVVFYSQNYSCKTMTQAAGRIDRLNTPFTDLYYYTFVSDAPIDKAIAVALKNKKTFSERLFVDQIRFENC